MSGRRLALFALVGTVGLVIPVITTVPASAVKAGDWCGSQRANQGELSTDPEANAEPLVCLNDRWQPGQPAAGQLPALPENPDPSNGPSKGPVGREAGDYCVGKPQVIRTLSGQTGQPLLCRDHRWVAETGVALGQSEPLDPVTDGLTDANVDGLSDSIAPHLTFDNTLGDANLKEPLPYDLGNPTGLPPGVVLPPGTSVLAGFPRAMPSEDWWKVNRWITEAIVATTDIEAVNAHFVQQCANIGWLFDPRRVTRLPVPTPPGKAYDQSAQMVLGECRTVLGSPTDPTRIRPWYLAWSATLRFGSPTVELVVELRSSPREGGRPG